MPKFDKKRSRKDSDTSDSGPEDRTPVKKSGGPPAKKPAGNPSKDGDEPSWLLGNMKFIKVSFSAIFETRCDQGVLIIIPGNCNIHCVKRWPAI